MLKGTYERRTLEDMGERYEAQLLNKQYTIYVCIFSLQISVLTIRLKYIKLWLPTNMYITKYITFKPYGFKGI